jgi:CHAT domain
MSHDDLLQTLTSQLHALAEQMIAIARACPFLRRPQAGRGVILSFAPTPPQRAIAGAMQKRFALWHAAVRSTLTRCGITDPSLQRTIEQFSGLIELRYPGNMMTPAPRLLDAFVDSVRTTALMLEELLHKYERHFRRRESRAAAVYDSFAVRISPADDRWLIRASHGGQCIEETANIPLSAAEMQHLLHVQLHADRGSVQNANPQEAASLARVGNRLFRSVFADLTGALYERARIQATLRKRALRIELDLPDEGIAAIPWELLHDGVRFLGLAQDISIARCIGARVASRVGEAQPLRMLLTVSSPRDLTRIVGGQERELVEEAVAPLIVLGLLQLDVETTGSIRALHRMLETARREERPYHVWHLAAHGWYDSEASRGALAMTAPGGAPHWVGAVELASLFSEESQLRLVVLSSCHAAEGNPALRWSAAATPFLLCGVPAVAAIQLAMSHAAATAFASQLYGAFVDGRSVEEAIAAGRRSIHDLPNYAEWMRPVLFMRGEENAFRGNAS